MQEAAEGQEWPGKGQESNLYSCEWVWSYEQREATEDYKKGGNRQHPTGYDTSRI